MKICKRGYECLQVSNEKGGVAVCRWSDYRPEHENIIGYLTEQSMEEILHNDYWKEFINSFLDGSYRYCDPDHCPFLGNNTLDRYMTEYVGEVDHPKELSISYDKSCNYMCPSCRSHNTAPSEEIKAQNFEKIRDEIRVFLNKVEILGANGMGEVFASPSIMELLSEWNPECEHPVVHLETNGSLFTPENWKKIESLGKFDLRVIITVMSFDNMTYQFLSGTKYDISRIENNLRFVKDLREKEVINHLTLATVVQERNFRTLPEYTRKCLEEFKADTVRLRTYYPYGVWPAHIEWFFDIRNVLHPYHKEYVEIMKDPIFDNPKVFRWAGDRYETSWDAVQGSTRDTKQYNLTRDLFQDEEFEKRFVDYLKNAEKTEVYIYAAGVLGKVLSGFIQNTEIQLKGFIDEYTGDKCYKGVPVYRMACEELDKSKLVIISLPEQCDCVEEGLNKAGFENVVTLEKLIQNIKSCNCC